MQRSAVACPGLPEAKFSFQDKHCGIHKMQYAAKENGKIRSHAALLEHGLPPGHLGLLLPHFLIDIRHEAGRRCEEAVHHIEEPHRSVCCGRKTCCAGNDLFRVRPARFLPARIPLPVIIFSAPFPASFPLSEPSHQSCPSHLSGHRSVSLSTPALPAAG